MTKHPSKLDDFGLGFTLGIAVASTLHDLARHGEMTPEDLDLLYEGDVLSLLLLMWKHGIINVKTPEIDTLAASIEQKLPPGMDAGEVAAIVMEQRIRRMWGKGEDDVKES